MIEHKEVEASMRVEASAGEAFRRATPSEAVQGMACDLLRRAGL